MNETKTFYETKGRFSPVEDNSLMGGRSIYILIVV